MTSHSQLMSSPVIAVVDDDPAVCNSLKLLLELEGFVVRVYRSGAELLDTDELAACNCFIIDQKLLPMSGLEVIAKLRSRRISTPAILITSYPNAALIARATMVGTPIVEKPLLGNALVDKIREVCRRAG